MEETKKENKDQSTGTWDIYSKLFPNLTEEHSDNKAQPAPKKNCNWFNSIFTDAFQVEPGPSPAKQEQSQTKKEQTETRPEHKDIDDFLNSIFTGISNVKDGQTH